jgi:AraC-like DNA-binding protein
VADKLVFSTDNLPTGLNEQRRQLVWRDMFAETLYPADMNFLPDRPMSVRFEFVPLRTIGVFHYQGTISALKGAASRQLPAQQPIIHIGFNSGPSTFFYDVKDKSTELGCGDMMLVDTDNPNTSYSNGANGWQGVQLSKQKLLELAPGAADLAYMVLPKTEAARMLRCYIEMVCNGGFARDPSLTSHIETTLLDLVALAIGAGRDVAELARMRGLRAARVQAIIRCIEGRFSDPSLSLQTIAQVVGLSPRYINALLAETGLNFTDRVNELRLQKAQRMLEGPSSRHTKVSDIALSCGFNEVSYFNRCFRRRFGTTPTQYRGGEAAVD